MLRMILSGLVCLLVLAGNAYGQQEQQGAQQQQVPQKQKVYGIHIEGTLTIMDPRGRELEERYYICERVCYPDEGRFVELFRSWVGEDTDSLQEWETSYTLDGKSFVMEREGISEGSGSLEGRNWSWDEISFEFTDDEGLLHKFTGEFSGKRCQRAGVVTDGDGQVVYLITDESNTITEEEFAVMNSIYHRIKQGFN